MGPLNAFRVKAAATLRRYFAPDFWVFFYKADNPGGGIVRTQSGQYPVSGKTREEAEANGLKALEERAYFSGDFYYAVRRPYLWER
jgi:hypothetical protein